MPTGTEIVMGFYPTVQIPNIDERSFKEGVPYADAADVLATLPIGKRAQYLMVNIAGIEYQFSNVDLTTLTVKNTAQSNTADNITATDTGGFFESADLEGITQEIGSAIAAIIEDVALLTTLPPDTVRLPAGASLTAKVAAAVETTDYPTGWTLSAVGDEGKNLQIVHTLIGREIDHITVKVTDTSGKRGMVPFRDAYSGWLEVDVMLTTPVNAAFTAGAGTLAAATYYYRVSAINATGETLASAQTSFAAAINTGVNVNWSAVTGATGYKVYGRTTGAELLIATVGSVTTYLDNGSITPAGALPISNTTGNTTLTIEGLAPNDLPLTIILTFA